MKKHILIIHLQHIFETSPDYSGEKILDICFIPEYRGERIGKFDGHFVGSKIKATLTRGYTEFFIDVHKVRHNAGGGYFYDSEFTNLVKLADAIFSKHSHFAKYSLINEIQILD